MSDPRIELYETYKDTVYLYLYRSSLNKQIAEDLTHDTFLSAFQSLGKFRGESSLKTWLIKIARNNYISFSQKKQNKLKYIPKTYMNTKPINVIIINASMRSC
ncbi:MAG: polymerase subunit sigma [Bacillales bacterium]|jgi:RNA polymerase sigma-70 factor (ECF subfamily)|nr:polymerase subunit sigma [Bacillales bacterium]